MLQGSIGVTGVRTRTSERRSHRRHVAVGLAAGLLALAGLAPATVSAQQQVTLLTPYPAIAIAPGADVSFDIEVQVAETGRVNLELSGVPNDWTATLRGGGYFVDGVLSTPDESTFVRLDVSVPVNAPEGTRTIAVTGTSAGATGRLELSIRINPTAAGELTLEPDIRDLRAAAGSESTFTLTLRNDTAETLTFTTTTTGQSGWRFNTQISAQPQAASGTIEAGATETLTITATPPTDVQAGVYPLAVRVTAGGLILTEELSVEITGSYAINLSTVDQRLSARGSAGSPIEMTFVISNNGSAALDFVSLSQIPPSGWSVSFDPAEIDAIPPGETATVRATITPSSNAISGDYTVRVTASSAEASHSQEIRVTVETAAIWGIVGLALLGALVLALWWVFRSYGRR